MDTYIDMYGDSLLYVFNKEQLKKGKEMIVVKDGTKIIDTTITTYLYSDDFESALNFQIPTKNRKTKQMLSLQESIDVVKKIAYGVLSFSYQDMPYGIGINHVYKDGKIYFHTGYEGFKLHAINQKVNYLIIEDLGINESMSTHNHSSIMIQGVLKKVDDLEIKKEVLAFLMKQLAPTNDRVITKDIADNTNILVLDIAYIHGKRHIR